MASIRFEIRGKKVSIHSRIAPLIELFTDYFRYYQPQILSTPDTDSELKLELKEFAGAAERDHLRDLLSSCHAKLIARTGVLSLWQSQQEAGTTELHLDCGSAFFTIHPTEGRASGWLSLESLDQPQILANTYTLFALLLLLRARGRYHLHAAAIVSPRDELWLVCGAQRAGKTTLATALGLSGWRPISDDSLLVGYDEDGAPRLGALKKSFHVGDELMERWPGLASADRRLRYLQRTCVDGLGLFDVGSLADHNFDHIDYILLPQITGNIPSRIESLNPSVALRQLAEQSTFFQLWPDHTARQWQALTTLASQARCFRFYSGPDLLDDPAVAAPLLNRVATTNNSR